MDRKSKIDQISQFSINLKSKPICSETDAQDFLDMCQMISRPYEESNKTESFLLFKTNNYITLSVQDPLTYLKKLNEKEELFMLFKLSGLKSLVKTNDMVESLSTQILVNINSIIQDIVKESCNSFKSVETHLNLIILLKCLFKKKIIQQVNYELRHQFFGNFMEYTTFYIKSFLSNLSESK